MSGMPLRMLPTPITTGLLLLLRRTGLPILGLAFFLVWTFVYLGLWWFRPEGSFTGPRLREELSASDLER